MPNRNQLPHEVHLTDPLKSITPRPYPKCDVCSALLKEWLAVSEPASTSFDRAECSRIAAEINEHRRKDERRAPAM
ncbi:hypothetical protein [Streptomyces sp. NBC_00385]|uniref:hypothetical protein n=1 Tax=Streptomyces sp. NBC_00385 TaxID=2975733 RepID=UPI002DDB6461|nr:hypothetical protein [Streptomyces sp. NBC_00385]WRZ07889.1 hypothetical protein OG959_33405 [Streptomyces sp. NBC_00385]